MNATLPGVDAPVRDVSKSQWFTPPVLARRIVEWALQGKLGLRVLEPSCGRGALVFPLLQQMCGVLGVDVDPENIKACREAYAGMGTFFIEKDFLDVAGLAPGDLDLAVMNPPFEGGQTEAHVMHALKFVPRVVCHCPLTTLEGIKRKAALWDKVQLHRMVIHSARPKYGEKGGATAMMTIDVTLGHTGAPTAMEWW